MRVYDIYNDINLASNDYLSFVYDYGYYLKISNYDQDEKYLRFFISSGSKLKTFGELKLDIIPFYEYLLSNYNLGIKGRFSKNPEDVRYVSLQLTTEGKKFYNPTLIKLDRRDLVDKDLSEYDDHYLSCISFYISIEDE